MNQERRLDIDIWEEDIPILQEKIKAPDDLGALIQILINNCLDEEKQYYQEIIDYLLDALEEEHMGSRIIYEEKIKSEFCYREV